MRILIACIIAFFVVAFGLLSSSSGPQFHVFANPVSKNGYVKSAPSKQPPSAAKPKSSENTPKTGAGLFEFGVEREMKESGR